MAILLFGRRGPAHHSREGAVTTMATTREKAEPSGAVSISIAFSVTTIDCE
jgi:hypothetical protein